MTRYIGLDAHSESCTIAVLGGSGKRLRHERFQTSAELLKSFIKEVPRPRHLCMEEGTLSEWLCEELTPVVDKLVVVMPDRNPGNKSDLIDACKLADDLRRDAIRRPVYKAPGCFRALREAARTHYVLQRDKVRTKSRLNALCRGCGQAYQRLLATTKPNLARLTIARRLAAAVLAMWKNGEDYEPTKHEGKTM